jgi:hypothetical protein
LARFPALFVRPGERRNAVPPSSLSEEMAVGRPSGIGAERAAELVVPPCAVARFAGSGDVDVSPLESAAEFCSGDTSRAAA